MQFRVGKKIDFQKLRGVNHILNIEVIMEGNLELMFEIVFDAPARTFERTTGFEITTHLANDVFVMP